MWQGRRGTFGRQGWNGNQVRAILSRFSDLGPPSLPEKSSPRSYLFLHTHTHPHVYPKSLTDMFFGHARNLKLMLMKKIVLFNKEIFLKINYFRRVESIVIRCSAIAVTSANFGS